MAFIELQGITKRFGSTTVVDQVDLHLEKGEVFSLLGPSGCGKTTLLRILAGFILPDAGRVIVDGQDLTQTPPNRRPINTVFQNYALFPHMTVWDNIAYGPTVAKRPRDEVKREVERMLALIRMEDHARKKPTQISGGQKQRVAIARALINKPQLLLLDEPLAALDLKLRQHMLLELERIHDEVGTTFLFVTHDQGEAMSLSDRIAVMNKGRVEQVGTPARIYEAPATPFVADFIGDTNLVEARVLGQESANYLRLDLGPLGQALSWVEKPLAVDARLNLSLRPEKFTLSREPLAESRERNRVRGRVEDVIYLGAVTKYRIEVGGRMLTVQQQHSKCLLDQTPITWNDEVWVSWHADDGSILQEVGA